MKKFYFEVVTTQPDEPAPEPIHTDENYCLIEAIKKKGRRKKSDPYEWRLTWYPWNDLNDSELIVLATHAMDCGDKEEMARWRVLGRHQKRSDLIRLIRGQVDPRDLLANPAHEARRRLSRLIYENWSFIHTQIRCNTLCWECPDAKALECALENRGMLRAEEKLDDKAH